MAPDLAIFAIAQHDKYVPEDAGLRWNKIADREAGGKWAGADVRTVRGGHVSGAIFEAGTFETYLVEMVQRVTEHRDGESALGERPQPPQPQQPQPRRAALPARGGSKASNPTCP